MPLVSPRQRTYAWQGKVTAALGHSGAYGTPLIVHREIASLWGIPDSACVTYTGTGDLGDVLLKGLDDRSRHAQRYRAVIGAKIRQNRIFLDTLSSSHPVLRAARPSPALR